MKYVIYRTKHREFVQRNYDKYGTLRLAKVYNSLEKAKSECIEGKEIILTLADAEKMTKHKGLYYQPDEIVQVITAVNV